MGTVNNIMMFQAVSTITILTLALADARFRGRPSATTTTSTTTEASSDDDTYVARAKELIDAGTCNEEYADETACGDNATSYYTEFVYNGRRVIVSSGIPDHDAESDQLKPNSDTRCEVWMYISLPLENAKGDNITDTEMGIYGLSVTGGTFFNQLSSDDGSLAVHDELSTLDSCFGHTSPANTYHYHANINCTDAGSATGANDPTQCIQIGYLNDGIPIYGYCQDEEGNTYTSCYQVKDGVTVDEVEHVSGNLYAAESMDDYEYDDSIEGCNLDEANGAYHPTTGVYSYFMTSDFPWVPMYYYGTEGEQDICSLDL